MSASGGGEGPFPPLGRMVVVGAGQVGTMLGMAARAGPRRSDVVQVVLVDRSDAVARASLARGAGDVVATGPDAGRAVEGADTVVLALPVPEIVAWIEAFGAHLGPDSFVIDTGSAKGVVVHAMRRHVRRAHAIGGHPVVGTEIAGPLGARPELLAGAPFVLTPVRADPVAAERGRALVALVGARPVEMSAQDHDEAIASVSHLPHLVASALAAALRTSGSAADARRRLASSGFKAATRLAQSDPAMVAGFLSANAPAVRAALAELRDEMDRLTSLLVDPASLERALATNRAGARATDGRRPGADALQ